MDTAQMRGLLHRSICTRTRAISSAPKHNWIQEQTPHFRTSFNLFSSNNNTRPRRLPKSTNRKLVAISNSAMNQFLIISTTTSQLWPLLKVRMNRFCIRCQPIHLNRFSLWQLTAVTAIWVKLASSCHYYLAILTTTKLTSVSLHATSISNATHLKSS